MSQNRMKICDKKIKTAELKVLKILSKIDNYKLNQSYVSQITLPTNHVKNLHVSESNAKCCLFLLSLLILLGGFYWIYMELSTTRCSIQLPSITKSAFRPPEDCSMCVDVVDVVRVSNITARDFEQFYAYKSRPVIITDATANWKAIQEFNFNFFAKFYRENKMGKRINDCFYFAYKSGLNSLQEVFSMEEKRSNLSGEPWYVGWSTCYDDETRKLRTYYNRPYFLPNTAESDMVDWIFMGGPGQGAHMHVDSVKHMSWQAQIRGRKEWQLAPPPECLYQCTWITFTVQPGEILVVDTNRWYHKTNVLPGDISITIGAEYD